MLTKVQEPTTDSLKSLVKDKENTHLVNSRVSHRNDLEVDRSAEGNYSTELYGAKAAQIIR